MAPGGPPLLFRNKGHLGAELEHPILLKLEEPHDTDSDAFDFASVPGCPPLCHKRNLARAHTKISKKNQEMIKISPKMFSASLPLHKRKGFVAPVPDDIFERLMDSPKL
jgi:hypothetical protein